jgi:hypothetical protein
LEDGTQYAALRIPEQRTGKVRMLTLQPAELEQSALAGFHKVSINTQLNVLYG